MEIWNSLDHSCQEMKKTRNKSITDRHVSGRSTSQTGTNIVLHQHSHCQLNTNYEARKCQDLCFPYRPHFVNVSQLFLCMLFKIRKHTTLQIYIYSLRTGTTASNCH